MNLYRIHIQDPYLNKEFNKELNKGFDIDKILDSYSDEFKDKNNIARFKTYYFMNKELEKDIIRSLFHLNLKDLNITLMPVLKPNVGMVYYELMINNHDLLNCYVKDILNIKEIKQIDKIIYDNFLLEYTYDKSPYYFIKEDKILNYIERLKMQHPGIKIELITLCDVLDKEVIIK